MNVFYDRQMKWRFLYILAMRNLSTYFVMKYF